MREEACSPGEAKDGGEDDTLLGKGNGFTLCCQEIITFTVWAHSFSTFNSRKLKTGCCKFLVSLIKAKYSEIKKTFRGESEEILHIHWERCLVNDHLYHINHLPVTPLLKTLVKEVIPTVTLTPLSDTCCLTKSQLAGWSIENKCKLCVFDLAE